MNPSRYYIQVYTEHIQLAINLGFRAPFPIVLYQSMKTQHNVKFILMIAVVTLYILFSEYYNESGHPDTAGQVLVKGAQ